MLSRLLTISRPVLWINTIGTTLMGVWLTGSLWNWNALVILVWV
nr:prenyltransferase [Actinomycetota bacterium]